MARSKKSITPPMRKKPPFAQIVISLALPASMRHSFNEAHAYLRSKKLLQSLFFHVSLHIPRRQKGFVWIVK